jgi:HEAT repeat protein
MLRKPNVKALYEDQDLEGLVAALRFPGSPEVRAEAARALGALSKLEAVESLVYSTRQDPDIYVQQAALAALHELLGNTAEAVIASYGPLPEDELWVPASPPEGPAEPGLVDIWKDLEPGRTEVKWEHDDISALIAVLRN